MGGGGQTVIKHPSLRIGKLLAWQKFWKIKWRPVPKMGRAGRGGDMVLPPEAVSLGVVDAYACSPLPRHPPGAPLVNLKEGQQEAEAEKLEEGVV